VGALVTLQLQPDSPIGELPWIITFGPLTDDEDWEPVVCGPYERPHALALAEDVVADEQLMAVVEPLLGYAAPDEIRNEIGVARAAAQSADAVGAAVDEAALNGTALDGTALDGTALDGTALDEDEPELGQPVPEWGLAAGVDSGPAAHIPLPTPAEVRAGMARVVRQLAD
jgi:hypothetical protein